MMARGVCLAAALMLLGPVGVAASHEDAARTQIGSIEGYKCHVCHVESTPGLVEQWRLGPMGQRGVNCFDCHGAQAGEADAHEHHGHLISVIVSPRDCGRCHPAQEREYGASAHAAAAEALAAFEAAGSPAAMAVGCRKCHGARVAVAAGGVLAPAGWPNSGSGRLNPDGSRGSCSSCHSRHRFSRADARRPESCGHCHRGPGQPQSEVYAGSRHGAAYAGRSGDMHFDRVQWRAGEDYADAPTCASCHMGAAGRTAVTHDVGARLSWRLSTPVPERRPDAQQRREAMQSVCARCHDAVFVANHFRQVDGFLEEQRDGAAAVAQRVLAVLVKAGRLTAAPADEPLDAIFLDIWHRAGSLSRSGAAMGSAEAVSWEGLREESRLLARVFLPEARKIAGETLWREIENGPGVPKGTAASPAAEASPAH